MREWRKSNMCIQMGLIIIYGRKIVKKDLLLWWSSIARICFSLIRLFLMSWMCFVIVYLKLLCIKFLTSIPNPILLFWGISTISIPIGPTISLISSKWSLIIPLRYKMPLSLSIHSLPKSYLHWSFHPISNFSVLKYSQNP